MPQIRRLGASVAIVVAMLMLLSTVAVAHPGPHPGRWVFTDRWVGTAGNDTYAAPDGQRDLIIGLAGNDELSGGDRRDRIRGNAGDDTIDGGLGQDLIRGGYGNDDLTGGDHADRIHGGPGDDDIDGQAGRDFIRAGKGDDTIAAVDGERDRIYCGAGEDTVTADEVDRVARNCENVDRVPAAAAS